MTKSLTEVTTSIFELLEPLDSMARSRALNAVLALLGENATAFTVANSNPILTNAPASTTVSEVAAVPFDMNENAVRWMRHNQISREALDSIFLIENGQAELIISDVPGNSRREKTVNCYLIVGIRNLISRGDSRFSEQEALEFCHLTDAYDKNNHTSNRNALGNRVGGSRTNGFTLTIPGQRDAAKLIKEMAV